MATKPVFAASLATSVASAVGASPKRAACLTSACILLSDVAGLLLVTALTVLGRHIATPGYRISSSLQFLPFLAIFFPASLVQGLYPGILIHPAEEIRRVFYSLCTVFLAWASILYLWHAQDLYSRSVFLVIWALGPAVILLFRHVTRTYCSGRSWWGIPAVILGSGANAQRIARKLRDGMMGVKVAGVFSEREILSWTSDMPPVLGDLESAPSIATTRIAQYAIVAMQDKSNRELQKAIQDYCRGFSHVLIVPDMQGVCSLGIQAREIAGELGLQLPQRLFHRGAGILKRSLDIAVSGSLLLLLSPLFAAVAVAIRLTSKGPVFFGHSRFGRDNRIFKAFKFRTMVVNADRVLAEHLQSHPEQRLEWERDHKLKNDPRITTVGKWLRRYSLDELPQLFNVFGGQMSLVGPRPIVSAEIPKYGRGYNLYTRVLPGITGLWQVSGRNNTTYDARVAFDEYYVYNWSIWLDMYILIRTVKVVLTADGAY
ncbi:MAG TPA: undecaprenyl-phosphate galactose phosphotransferase WbaP [Bryobacteraceae bacterium]|jgi:Undecaprenyl-phosphate galactose phosphotransferase WbaP|nr:undecaprenyl-phosphate galactose phosphotransferase WbaP [Bryobacteraceae bacterium]